MLLWELAGSRSIGRAARETIAAAAELRFSAVSFAEIGVKVSIGKLTVPDDLTEAVLQSGVKMLALEAQHGLAVAELPMHHRDPFDRLLIAQARLEGLAVLTADHRFAEYDITVVDAEE